MQVADFKARLAPVTAFRWGWIISQLQPCLRLVLGRFVGGVAAAEAILPETRGALCASVNLLRVVPGWCQGGWRQPEDSEWVVLQSQQLRGPWLAVSTDLQRAYICLFYSKIKVPYTLRVQNSGAQQNLLYSWSPLDKGGKLMGVLFVVQW